MLRHSCGVWSAERDPDEFHGLVEAAWSCRAQKGCERGKGQLNGSEVGAVGRQKPQARTVGDEGRRERPSAVNRRAVMRPWACHSHVTNCPSARAVSSLRKKRSAASALTTGACVSGIK